MKNEGSSAIRRLKGVVPPGARYNHLQGLVVIGEKAFRTARNYSEMKEEGKE